jgi:hypothetical protein
MHRVDFKKRKKLYIRIFTYGVMTTLTIGTSIILLFAALGYRFGDDGVIRSGLLLVDSKPVAAEVYINGENKDDPTSSRFVLPAGGYNVKLMQDGYKDWSRDVLLEPSTVENLYYALLVPEKLTPKAQETFAKPDVVSQAPNRKQAFVYGPSYNNPLLVKLDSSDSTVGEIALPSTFVRENGSLGVLRVADWSLKSRHVLVEQKLSNQTRLLNIDTERPAESVDVTAVLKGRNIGFAKYVGDSTDRIYGLQNGKLSRYSLKDGKSTLFLTNVRSYAPFADDSVSFVRVSDNSKQLEGGVLKGNEVVVVHRSTVIGGAGVSKYVKYENDFYLALQMPGEKKVTIYANPLSEPILREQLPYSFIKLADAKKLTASSNSQFFLAQNGIKLAVYDLEHDKQKAFSAPKNTTSVNWIDSHHLGYKSSNGKTYISEYDGANRYEMAEVSFGELMYSADYRTSFRVITAGSKARLDSFDMVVKN